MMRSALLSTFRRAPLFAAAFLGLFLCAAVLPAQGQHPEPAKGRRLAEGTDIFRMMLHLKKFTALHDFEELNESDPKDCILIVLGNTKPLTLISIRLERFLKNGGAALIASDKEVEDFDAKRALSQAVGVSITGYTWKGSPDESPDYYYRGLPFCPYIISDDARFMQHPEAPHNLKVATNLPSTLALEALRMPVDVWLFGSLPEGTQFDPPEGTQFDPKVDLKKKQPFAVAGNVGQGRVIVLADHSIFINEMMLPTDNDNVLFTANCLQYLSGGNGQRKKVLFIDDGVIQPSFEGKPGKKPLSSRDLPKVLLNALLVLENKINKDLNDGQNKLTEFDKDDGFNKGLWDKLTSRPGRLQKVLSWLTIGMTLLLSIYGCYRLSLASRYRAEAAVPALTRVARTQKPTAATLEQRHEDQRAALNLWETGRQLARDAFEASGVAAPSPYREPLLKVSGWGQRGRLKRTLRLWRLAFLDKPMRLEPRSLAALVVELEALKADLKNGKIQLA